MKYFTLLMLIIVVMELDGFIEYRRTTVQKQYVLVITGSKYSKLPQDGKDLNLNPLGESPTPAISETNTILVWATECVLVQ